MNCKKARNLLSLRLDGRVSYGEERELSRHLEACRSCASEYAGLERTVRSVQSLPEFGAPETFLNDVLQAVREAGATEADRSIGWVDRARDRLRGLLWIPSFRFAAAALCLGLVVGVGGSMLAFRSPSGTIGSQMPAVAASTLETPAMEQVSNGAVAPLPSGPFEELVEEMLERLENETPGTEAQPDQPGIDWGSTVDFDQYGRQVGADAESGAERDPDHRVTIAY